MIIVIVMIMGLMTKVKITTCPILRVISLVTIIKIKRIKKYIMGTSRSKRMNRRLMNIKQSRIVKLEKVRIAIQVGIKRVRIIGKMIILKLNWRTRI